MAGVASISGRVGNYCFKTMKKTGRVYMQILTSKEHRSKRKKVPSEAELRARERFSKIAGIVSMMRKAGSKLDTKTLWKLVQQAL